MHLVTLGGLGHHHGGQGFNALGHVFQLFLVGLDPGRPALGLFRLFFGFIRFPLPGFLAFPFFPFRPFLGFLFFLGFAQFRFLGFLFLALLVQDALLFGHFFPLPLQFRFLFGQLGQAFRFIL